jgi:hypothetical protein
VPECVQRLARDLPLPHLPGTLEQATATGLPRLILADWISQRDEEQA